MENEVIIKVDVNTQEAARRLAEATDKVRELKAEQKSMTKAYQEGRISAEQYTQVMVTNKAELEKATRAVKSNTAILQAANIESVKTTQSLDEQRQAVNTLQKAYANLSGAEKAQADQEGGLRDQIKAATDQLKEQESAIGDNRRNVGNYTESIKQAIPQLDSFSKKMKALWANPWTAIIAGVVLVLKQLIDAFKRSEDRVNEIKVAFAPLQGAVDLITKGFDALAKVVSKGVVWALEQALKGVQWMAKALDALGAKFGKNFGLSEAFEEAAKNTAELTAAEIAYAKHHRQWIEDEAKLNNDIAKLRDKAAQKDKYTIQERIAFMEAAINKEKERAKVEKELAQERLRILELDGNRAENDAAANDALAQARAEVVNADTRYFEATRKLNAQLMAFRAELVAQEAALMAVADATDDAAAADEKLQAQREKALAALRQKMVQWTQTDLERVDEEMNAALDTWGLTEEEKTAITEHYAQERERIMQEAREAEAQADQEALMGKIEAVQQWANAAMGALSAINDAANAAQDNELAKYEKTNKEKKKSLDNRLKQGLISQEEYDAGIAAADEELNAKQQEIEISQAKRAKALNIMQAIINTALAITTTIAQMGATPWGLAAAALAGITGAAQVAAIAAEPLPQFEDGGVVPGTSYKGDKVLVRANSGEAVVTPNQAQNLIDLANNGVAGGIDYELLGATMAQAVAAQPAPVMAYSEFKDFTRQTATYNEFAKI